MGATPVILERRPRGQVAPTVASPDRLPVDFIRALSPPARQSHLSICLYISYGQSCGRLLGVNRLSATLDEKEQISLAP